MHILPILHCLKKVFLVFYFIFVHNAPEIIVTDELVALLQQEIAFVFIGWFRCGLQLFFGEEKPFPAKETDLEISARGRYHTCRNAWENCKSPRKWVQSLCAPLRPLKSEMKENFYTTAFYIVYCRCAPVYKYFAISLQGVTKNCQVRTDGTKSAW